MQVDSIVQPLPAQGEPLAFRIERGARRGEHSDDVGQPTPVAVFGQIPSSQRLPGGCVQRGLLPRQNRFGGQRDFDLTIGPQERAFVTGQSFANGGLLALNAGFQTAAVIDRLHQAAEEPPGQEIAIGQIS